MDRNLDGDLVALNNYEGREDAAQYTTLLRKILELFGLGIIDSLEYTLGKYLRQTEGPLANENREDWEEKAVEGLCVTTTMRRDLSQSCEHTNACTHQFHLPIYQSYRRL
jgi:hypothetical protein